MKTYLLLLSTLAIAAPALALTCRSEGGSRAFRGEGSSRHAAIRSMRADCISKYCGFLAHDRGMSRFTCTAINGPKCALFFQRHGVECR